MPFCNDVAQARLGISEQDHESFFRQMLGDISEPTLPFGLQDVQGDARGIAEISLPLAAELCTAAAYAGAVVGRERREPVSPGLGPGAGRAGLVKQQVVFGTVLMGRMQGSHAITVDFPAASVTRRRALY